jgi:hypothetical protein
MAQRTLLEAWLFSFFAAPEMKSVRENYVAKQIVLRAIVDVERGVELEIARDVAGETDRR